MPQNILANIKSERVRNLVRGILSASNDVISSDVFDRLYPISSLEDRRISLVILAQAQQNSQIKLSLPFPPAPPAANSVETRDDLGTSAFLVAQERRLERYADELRLYVGLIARFNHAVEKCDATGLGEALNDLRQQFGFSVHLTRKVLSLVSRFEHDKAMLSALRPYYEGVTAKRHLLHRAMEDTFDLTHDYIETRRNFLRHVQSIRFGLAARTLVQHHFSPIPSSNEEWVRRARAYAAYSLPDLVTYVLESRIIGGPTDSASGIAQTFKLPADVAELYADARTNSVLESLDNAAEREPLAAEQVQRYATAWLCDDAITSFFAPIERYVGPRLSGDFGAERPFITAKPFDDDVLDSMPSASSNSAPDKPPSDRLAVLLNDEPAGLRVSELQRTLFLIRLVENGKSFAHYDGLRLLSLLDRTWAVSYLLSQLELDGAFPSRPSDRLYEMLRTTLKFNAVPKISTDFDMRSSTEQLVLCDFDGSILHLLQFLRERAPEVAAFYMAVWTERFLVQCYKLYKSAYDVNEARRSLLEWYGHETEDPVLLERARSLGLENKLARIRHDIDSQRLYVDLVRFKEWMLDKLADPLRRIATSSTAQEVPDTDIDLRDEVEVVVNPEYSLANIVGLAFSEFCCNTAYGVDSYIGRRIRHGTFHGTLHKSASDLIADILENPRCERVHFEAGLTSWLSRFDAEVKQFPQERLQVRSDKKPKGLLIPYVGHPTQRNMLKYAVEQVRGQLVDRDSIPEVVDVISQVCWVLLQPNLTAIQRELERWRGEKLTLHKEELYRGVDALLDEQARTIVRRINERVSETIQQIAAWFAAPKETTPSATLQELFHVVRVEVAEQVAGFDPQVIEPESSGLRIVGHRYQYVYDALYVLVHNAALHGKKGGRLELKLVECIGEKTTQIDVTVGSQFPDNCDQLRGNIEKSMEASMDDAMVTEGSTGIRKLRALAYPKPDISDVRVTFPEDRVEFTFRITLPTL